MPAGTMRRTLLHMTCRPAEPIDPAGRPPRPTTHARSRLAGSLGTFAADAACVAVLVPVAGEGALVAGVVAAGLLLPAAVSASLAAREMAAPDARDPLATGLALQVVALGLASLVLSLGLEPVLWWLAASVANVASWSGRRAHLAWTLGRDARSVPRTARTRATVHRAAGVAVAAAAVTATGPRPSVYAAAVAAAVATLLATRRRSPRAIVAVAGERHRGATAAAAPQGRARADGTTAPFGGALPRAIAPTA